MGYCGEKKTTNAFSFDSTAMGRRPVVIVLPLLLCLVVTVVSSVRLATRDLNPDPADAGYSSAAAVAGGVIRSRRSIVRMPSYQRYLRSPHAQLADNFQQPYRSPPPPSEQFYDRLITALRGFNSHVVQQRRSFIGF